MRKTIYFLFILLLLTSLSYAQVKDGKDITSAKPPLLNKTFPTGEKIVISDDSKTVSMKLSSFNVDMDIGGSYVDIGLANTKTKLNSYKWGFNSTYTNSTIMKFSKPMENSNPDYICPKDLPKIYGVRAGECIYVEPQWLNTSDYKSQLKLDSSKDSQIIKSQMKQYRNITMIDEYTWQIDYIGFLDPSVVTTNMTLFLPMNESTGANLRDYAGNIQNNGTYNANCRRVTTEKVLGIECDGGNNDYVHLTSITELDFAGTSSVSFCTIIKPHANDTNKYFFTGWDRLKISYNPDRSFKVGVFGYEYSSTPILSANSGGQFCMVFDNPNNNILYYFNGTNYYTKTGFSNTDAGTYSWLNIMTRADDMSFHGYLSNLRYWNGYALSATEVNDTYTVDMNLTPTGGSPPATSYDGLNISLNTSATKTNNQSNYFEWLTTGNYSYSEVYQGTTLKYNGSNKYWNNTGLLNNTAYNYNITVRWNSTLSNSTTFTLTTSQNKINRLPAVTNFINASQNNQSVYLTWSAVTGAEKYLLYGGDGINWFNTTELFYNWTGLLNNTFYQFNISAYNSTLVMPESLMSKVTTITHQNPYVPPPPPPPTITVTIDSYTRNNQSIKPVWSTTGNYTYSILKRNGTIVYNGTLLTFNDTNLLNNTGYLYNVTAYFNDTVFNSTTQLISTLQNTVCTEDLTNSTPSAWFNMTSCSIYDLINQNRTYVRYDINACGYSNTTFNEYQNATCDFCSTNSTISICNTDEVDYNMNQLAIALIIIAYFVILFYLATTWDYNLAGNNPENKKKNVIQAMLTILGVWLSYGLLQFANLIAISSSMTDLYSLIETFLTISMYLNITISSYMAIFLLKNLLQALNSLGKGNKTK